jgi:hypothetical protein
MTLPAGHQVLASELTALANPTRVGVTLRRAAGQSIASGGSGTAISWDTVDAGNSPSFITVTSATITVPAGEGGLYAMTYHGAGAWTTRVFANFAITTSLTGYPASTREDTNPSDVEITHAIGPIPLLAGDSFTVVQFHQTGSNVNVTAWLACYKVGV